MNFDFSDDQRAIKATARELLSARVSLATVRERAEAGAHDEALWRELVELGWPGISVSDAYGGQSLGMVELAVLAEEIGYALAPVPFLSTSAAALLLSTAGSSEQRARWLPSLLTGEVRATAGAALVADAAIADLAILLGNDAHLCAPPRDVEVVETLDLTRRFGRISPVGDPLDGDVARGRQQVLVAVAAETLGVAERAMDLAVAYAKEREQFGRPIGAFQAVAHRCADMLLDVERLRSLVYYAAWAADADPSRLPLASAMAAATASDRGWRVCASALQVFGGIGFTWEHDIHLLLRRSKVNADLFSSGRAAREQVAEVTLG